MLMVDVAVLVVAVLLWLMFGAALLWRRQRLATAYRSFRAAPVAVQAVETLLLFAVGAGAGGLARPMGCVGEGNRRRRHRVGVDPRAAALTGQERFPRPQIVCPSGGCRAGYRANLPE